MALATFKIDDDLWQQFKDRAEQDDYSASALLKSLIRAYLDDRIKLDDLSKRPENLELIDNRIQAYVAPLQDQIDQLEAKVTALLNIKFRR